MSTADNNSGYSDSSASYVGSWYVPASYVMLSAMWVSSGPVIWGSSTAPFPVFSGWIGAGPSGFEDTTPDMSENAETLKKEPKR